MSNKTNNKRFLVTYADQEVTKDSAIKLLGVKQVNVKEGVSFMSADRAALKDKVLHFENVGVSVLDLTSEEAKKLATQKGILAVEEDVEVFALDMEPEGFDHDYQPEIYINQEEMVKLEANKSKGGAKVKSDLRTKEAFAETVVPFKTQNENTIVGDKTVPEEESMPFNFERFAGQSNLVADKLLGDEKQTPLQAGGFTDGYKKAMVDMFSSMLDVTLKKDASESYDEAAASAEGLDTVTDASFSYIGRKPIYPPRPEPRPKPWPWPVDPWWPPIPKPWPIPPFVDPIPPRTRFGTNKPLSELNLDNSCAPIDSQSASYIPWNIRMVKAPGAWARGYDGWGVKVAVLDTGIDYNHPDLYVFGGVDFSGSGSYKDYNGHGTHCAGIIAAREYRGKIVGVAPRAQLYAVKVLNNNGSGYTSDIIAGMEWCMKNGIKVASMSLGGAYAPTEAYKNAVSRCQQNGVLVVAAAGNSGHTNFPWVNAPANSAREGWWSPSPIAVGAVDSNNNLAYFSSRGRRYLPWNPVGCVAPGVNVWSTYLNNGYTTMSGTSMACPHVAGLAALLCERWKDKWTYWIKKQILIGTYYSHPYPKSVEKGFGLIDCDYVVSTNYLNSFHESWKAWYLFR